MPLSRANPPLAGGRRKPQTRRLWPAAQLIVSSTGPKYIGLLFEDSSAALLEENDTEVLMLERSIL